MAGNGMTTIAAERPTSTRQLHSYNPTRGSHTMTTGDQLMRGVANDLPVRTFASFEWVVPPPLEDATVAFVAPRSDRFYMTSLHR